MSDKGGLEFKFLDKLKAIGGKIEGLASDVGSTAASAGKSFVSTVSSIPGSLIADSDFERIKSLNQLARQHGTGNNQRKKYSDVEWEAAEKRADSVIQQIAPGYLEPDFDPVKHELEQLSNEAGPDEIDAIVEKLTAGVETVSGKLSRHVMKRRDRLLEGINTVATVEDDLKQAFMITRTSRATLKNAGEEVMQNMRVAGQTRRKQGYMLLIEVCSNIKRARDLQQTLKRAQENGEYGEAILLCMQCFQGVESLKELRVSAELRATVQRLYVETLGRLDSALTTICGHFDPQRYGKVLEGYLLQSIPGKQLAEKVLQGFKDFIYDATMRVVRSMLLLRPKMTDGLSGSSSLDGSYPEMCRGLSVEFLRPCLLKLMEVLHDVMCSYHIMACWHKECLAQQAKLGIVPASDTDEPPSPSSAAAAEEARRALQSSTNFLGAVAEVLSTSRKEVFDVGAGRVMHLLNIPGLFKGEDFLQVVDWTQKFLGAGEAFVGGELTELRSAVGGMTTRFFESYHRSNMDSLSMLLHTEQWKNMAAAAPASSSSSASSAPLLLVSINLDAAVRSSPLYQPPFNSPGAEQDFGRWVARDNPFKQWGVRPAKGKKAAAAAASRSSSSTTAPLGGGSSVSSTLASIAPSRNSSLHSVTSAEIPEDVDGTTPLGASRGSSQQQQQGNGAAASRDSAQSTGRQQQQEGAAGRASSSEPTASSSAAGGADGGGAGMMLTVSSQQALKLVQAYGQLLKPLSSHAEAVLHALYDVFDMYLLATFIFFSGISLEVLVWQDDVLPMRLKSALMRILTSTNSKYRPQVEELLRLKPVTAPVAPAATSGATSGISFLDKFAAKMESIANDLERSAQRLGDKVQALPTPSALTAAADALNKAVDRVESQMNHPGNANPVTLYGLHERIVAAESLVHIAEEIKAGRAALQAELPQQMQRDLEAFFSPRGIVEASSDMKNTLFRGGARALLQPMLDSTSGTAVQIAATDYALREPSVGHHRWAAATVATYAGFKENMAAAQLPPHVKNQIWEHAVETGAKVMVEGLSRIRRCTLEGRASMTLDVSYVEKQLRALAPPGLVVNLRSVDIYVTAFYLPWEELARWSQLHLAEYKKHRIMALVELIAEAYKIKKSARNELVAHIETFSREFGSNLQ